MPIVMDGYVVVRSATLSEHASCLLRAVIEPDGIGVLRCSMHEEEIAREYRSTSLPCGCRNAEDHAEGVAIQERYRKSYRLTRSACVGCYLGDDGPSIHSCYIHPC